LLQRVPVAHAAGARVGMDQLLGTLRRLMELPELGPQKLEVPHPLPLSEHFPATALLRPKITEPACRLQPGGRAFHRAQRTTDAVGDFGQCQFRLPAQQGQDLVRRAVLSPYRRLYRRFYRHAERTVWLHGLAETVGDRAQHELDEAAAIAGR